MDLVEMRPYSEDVHCHTHGDTKDSVGTGQVDI